MDQLAERRPQRAQLSWAFRALLFATALGLASSQGKPPDSRTPWLLH